MIRKLDKLDRLAQCLIVLVALGWFANAIFMLWNPLRWYEIVPTATITGPPNHHFIRDIGLAYVGSAAFLGVAVMSLSLRWFAAIAGTGWPSLHGLLHVWEMLTDGAAANIFWEDFPAVLGLPLLVWAALGIQARRIGLGGPAPAQAL
jgi:hypothetical protein